jgi:hypothetical protein
VIAQCPSEPACRVRIHGHLRMIVVVEGHGTVRADTPTTYGIASTRSRRGCFSGRPPESGKSQRAGHVSVEAQEKDPNGERPVY